MFCVVRCLWLVACCVVFALCGWLSLCIVRGLLFVVSCSFFGVVCFSFLVVVCVLSTCLSAFACCAEFVVSWLLFVG